MGWTWLIESQQLICRANPTQIHIKPLAGIIGAAWSYSFQRHPHWNSVYAWAGASISVWFSLSANAFVRQGLHCKIHTYTHTHINTRMCMETRARFCRANLKEQIFSMTQLLFSCKKKGKKKKKTLWKAPLHLLPLPSHFLHGVTGRYVPGVQIGSGGWGLLERSWWRAVAAEFVEAGNWISMHACAETIPPCQSVCSWCFCIMCNNPQINDKSSLKTLLTLLVSLCAERQWLTARSCVGDKL